MVRDTCDLPRRKFVLIAGSTAVWPFTVGAQATTYHRIGFLCSSTAAKYAGLINAFRLGLHDHGYEEGRNIAIEFGFADDDNTRLPGLAAELVKRRVEVLVTQGTPATRAAQKATNTLPIVMAVAGDAVTAGLVSSLAHPGGNVTGNTFFAPELAAKRLDLIKQAVPQIKRVAVIMNPANPVSDLVMQAMSHTGAALQLELVQFPVTATSELKDAFTWMSASDVHALIAFEDGVTIGNAALIAGLALDHKLPLAGFPSMAKSGALIGYGADIPALFRRAAYFIDMIIKGKQISALPVERAEKFQFLINEKAAARLGITIPPLLIAAADQMIQ